MLGHHEVARHVVVYTVQCFGELPRLGRIRTSSSTNHCASSCRVNAEAESEIIMHLGPRGGIYHPQRSILPHETVRKVAARPPCKKALQVGEHECITVAVLLWGWSCPRGGAPASDLRLRVVLVASARFVWGVRGFPVQRGCATFGRWATRPGVVYVAAPDWGPMGVWVGDPWGPPRVFGPRPVRSWFPHLRL